ncbi:MAG: AMP-binding protein [Sphingobacteriales bacterium]|nr:MAG: AMP-binding protein [Sphingobacteriales bacterium]
MQDRSVFKTPLYMLYQWESQKPKEVFLKQPVDGRWINFTWEEAADQIRRMAAALKALNLPSGSKIAMVSKNCAHWLMADLAIMMSGHISVPLYPNITAATLNYILQHSEAKVLFVGKLDDWSAMKPGLTEDVYCISFPDMYKTDKEFDNWDTLIAQHEPLQGEIDRDLDEMMTIIYTSGTTGKPKGVMHSFYTFSYAITNAMKVIDISDIKDKHLFSYLPLSHIAERMLVEMGSIYFGTKVYFAQSLDTFAENLQFAEPSIFLAVPRIWTKFQKKILEKLPQKKLNLLLSIPVISTLIKNKIKKSLGLTKAKFCFTGAAPIPASLLQWFQKLGITIQEVYAMTENSAYSHFTRPDRIEFGYVGQPMPHVSVKISEIGEILVKSDANMLGYYKEPEITAATFDENHYLKTGDKGIIGKDNFLKITGRVKEIFKTEKGKYVAPAPIEMELSENEFVEQVCVVGANLPQPIALVVLSEAGKSIEKNRVGESLTDTVQKVNGRFEKHEHLKTLVVVKEEWTVENSLLTPTLKIKRNPIEEMYGSRFQLWYNKDEKIVWE